MKYENSITRIGDRPGAGIQQWLVRRLADRLFGPDEPRPSVLEIGTGVGRFAYEIVRRGYDYVGVEPTATLRFAAHARLKDANVSAKIVNARLPELEELADSGFTHIVASHVLEHAETPAAALEWMESMTTKLGTRGKILIICPNALDLKGYFFDSDWTHSWISTTSRIAAIGEELGLEVVEEIDLRGTFSNPIIKFVLSVVSKFFPTAIVNLIGLRFLGLRNFGTGIQTALLWRMSWVVLQQRT
jgi:SAM-dependent methyltransferase